MLLKSAAHLPDSVAVAQATRRDQWFPLGSIRRTMVRGAPAGGREIASVQRALFVFSLLVLSLACSRRAPAPSSASAAVPVVAAAAKGAALTVPVGQPGVVAATAVTASAAVAGPADHAAATLADSSTAVFAEGDLIGLRDAPIVVHAVGSWMGRHWPALTNQQAQTWYRQAQTAVALQVRAHAQHIEFAVDHAGWGLALGAAGCQVHGVAAGTATDTSALGPVGAACDDETAAVAAVEATVVALARPDLARSITIESFSMIGVGSSAIAELVIAIPKWRTRTVLRARADGELLGLSAAGANLELTPRASGWQLHRGALALWQCVVTAPVRTAERTLLRVPYTGNGEPSQLLRQAATAHHLTVFGPIAVELALGTDGPRLVAARQQTLAAAQHLQGAVAVVASPVGALLLAQPVAISRQNVAQLLSAVAPGCVEIVLLGAQVPAPQAKGPAQASVAAIRRCQAAN